MDPPPRRRIRSRDRHDWGRAMTVTSYVAPAGDAYEDDTPIIRDLRRQVREMLIAGKSDDDVRNYMVARYGDFILFRPRVAARTIWLWSAPGVLLLIGAAVAVRITKQRAALVAQDNEPVEEDTRSS